MGIRIFLNLNNSKEFPNPPFHVSSFEAKDGSENKLDGNHMADLQASHFGFTDLKKGVFTSDYEDRYRKADGDPANMDKDRKEYLESSHFNMGKSKLNYKSEQKSKLQDLGGGPARLDPNLEKDLRNHHFEIKDRESVNKV